MNEVRKRVLNGLEYYADFAKHKDLVAFTVGADYFTYDYVTGGQLQADFAEVVVAVEKDWLLTIMLADGIEDPMYYLQNEYTWDDSVAWLECAKMQGKIAVIEFC